MKSSVLVLSVLLILAMGMIALAQEQGGQDSASTSGVNTAPPEPGTMPPTVQCAGAGDACAATTSAGAVSNTCCPDLQCVDGRCVKPKSFFTRLLNFFGIEQGKGTTNGESQEQNGPGTGEQNGGNAPEPQGSLPGQPNGTEPPTGAPGTAPGGSETASRPRGTTTPDYSCCRVTVCGQGATEYICPPGQQCGQDCRIITCQKQDYQQQDYCEYNGRRYEYGEQFKQDCNVCVCNENGRVTCTERPCVQCDQDVQTCYPPKNLPTTTTTAAPQPVTPVRCEGSYDYCVAKYGKCECGYTETTTNETTNVTTKPIVTALPPVKMG